MREFDRTRAFMREICAELRVTLGEVIEFRCVACRALAIDNWRDRGVDAFVFRVTAHASRRRRIRAAWEFGIVSGEGHWARSFGVSIRLLLAEAVAGNASICDRGALKQCASPTG